MAWWKRLVQIILIPVALPGSVAVVLLVLTPVALVQLACLTLYWARFRLFGTPIPPKWPPPGAARDEIPSN